MSFSAGSIGIDVFVNDGVSAGLQTIETSLAAFEGRVGSLLNRLSGMTAATAGLLSIGAAFGVMANQAAQVQQNVANLNAVLRATPQQLQSIRQAGLTLSQQTPFTDAQIIDAQRTLAKARTTPAQLADAGGVTRDITNLASATFSQPAQAAQSYVAASKDFQLGIGQSKEVVNLLAQAVDSSTASLADFQSAFKQIGPVAMASGQSLKDTVAAVADLQNAGLKGDAGTAIRTFLARIQDPSREAKAAMDDLGLSFYDASGQLEDFGAIADQIRFKTAGLSEEVRNKDLTAIFGTRGVRVADIFAEEGGQGIRDTEQHMAEIGDASQIAAEKLDTVQGSLHQLASSFNVLAVQGGNAFLPMIRGAADATRSVANLVSAVNGAQPLAPQLGVGAGVIGAELLGAQRLGSYVQRRTASPQQQAQDALRGQYQQELVAFEGQRIVAGAPQGTTAFAKTSAAELQQRAVANQRIEQVEIEHQARMAAIDAEGQAKIALLPKFGASGLPVPGQLAPIQAEMDAAKARQIQAYEAKVAGQSSAVSIVKAPVKPDFVIAEEEAAAASFKGKLTAAVGGLGPLLGEFGMPILIYLTAKQMLLDPIDKQITDSIANEQTKWANQKIDIAIGVNMVGEASTDQTRDSLLKAQTDIQNAIQQVPTGKWHAQANNPSSWLEWALGGGSDNPGGGYSEQEQKIVDDYKASLKRIEDQLSQTSPEAMKRQRQQGVADLHDDESSILNELKQGRIDYDQARSEMIRAAIERTPADDPSRFKADLADATKEIDQQLDAQRTQQREAEVAAADLARAQTKQASDLRNLGVPDQYIQQTVFHKGDADEESAAKEVIQFYKDAKAAADEAAKAADDFNKRLADSRAQASDKLTSLVNSNQSAMLSAAQGIDLSQGVDSLSKASDELAKVRENLSMLGQSNPHLDSLASLAAQFKGIADAEQAASDAMNTFLLTLSKSDQAQAQVGALEKRVADAYNAALERVARGQGTDQDQQLIARAPGYYNSLKAQGNTLQGNDVGDILGLMDHTPDFSKYVQSFRQQVAANPDLLVKVRADTTAIRQALDAIAKQEITVAVNAYVRVDPNSPGYGLGIVPNGGVSPYDEVQPTVPPTPPSYGGTAWPGSRFRAPTTGDVTPGGNAGNVGFGGGAGGYSPFAYGDYQKVLSAYPASPINNQGDYQTLLAVAQQAGIDPRLLMSVMQTESGYGANAGKIGKQFNYGGMGVNNRGFGHDSGIHATDGGPEYAGYNSYGDFLKDIAGWIRENGSSFSNYQTADRGQGKGNAYADLQTALPAASGGTSVASAVSATRQQIVQKALSQVGIDELVGYCEKFVEDTVQAITGKRGPVPGAKSAEAAIHSIQANQPDLITKNPQPGDLVYYDTGTGTDGHVAIYAGGGMQVSTWDHGAQTGANRQIHTEPVGQGAIYVSVDGTQATASTTPSQRAAEGYGPGTYSSSGGATIPSSAPPQMPLYTDLSAQFARLNQLAPGMDAQDLGNALKVYGQIQPFLAKIAVSQLSPFEQQSPEKVRQVTGGATKQSLDITNLVAEGLQRARSGGQDLADIYQKIAATGSPIAANLNQQLSIMAAQVQTQRKITDIQDQQRQAERTHSDEMYSRQVADFAEQKSQTELQWSRQDEDTQLADRRREAQRDATVQSRKDQDAQRQLEFDQQVKGTDLQNSLTDVQKKQTDSRFYRTSQEDELQGRVKSTVDPHQASVLAGQLSMMHDQDTAQKDKDAKAIDDLQEQIRLQTKSDNLASYNLQTQILMHQRTAEDAQQGFDQTEANTAVLRQMADRSHQRDLWDLQESRMVADHNYEVGQQELSDQLAGEQKLAAAQDAQLASAQQAVDLMGQFWDMAGPAASALGSAYTTSTTLTTQAQALLDQAQQTAITSAYNTSVAGLTTSSGVPFNQFPQPGASLPTFGSGGTTTGDWAIVGDPEGGGTSGYEELVNFRTRQVVSNRQLRGGAISLSGITRLAGGTGGGGVTVLVPLSVTAGADEEAVVRAVMPMVERRVREGVREANQQGRNKLMALGRGR